MSFIIQWVDLPKGYKALHMRVQSDGVVRYLIEGDDPVHIIDGARAIQIPKGHGRLIDSDKIAEEIPAVMDMQDTYLPIHFKELVIDNAPTILEAEE